MFPTHIGDYVKLVEGVVLTTQDGGSATAVTGDYIDREGYESALVNLQASYTNAQDTKDVTVSYSIQVYDCATSGGTYATYGTAETVTLNVVTTSATDVVDTVVNEMAVNLRGAKRYIKIKVTPDDTAGTDNGATGDTDVFGATVCLAGAEVKPAA